MKMVRNQRGMALLIGVLLLAVAPLRGQEQRHEPAPQQSKIAVEVKVVTVLATVRDKKGQVVTNLGKDDFILDEDEHRSLEQLPILHWLR